MSKNRTIPFGYKMMNGVIVISKEESKAVRYIYSEYAKGESYKSIAASLTTAGVIYISEKKEWNKNMVARILKSDKYTGTEEYPAIICVSEKAAAKAMEKPYSQSISHDLKRIKPKMRCAVCGGKVQRRWSKKNGTRWCCENSPRHISQSVTDEVVKESLDRLISEEWERLYGNEKLEENMENCKNELETLADEYTEIVRNILDDEAAFEKVKEFSMRAYEIKTAYEKAEILQKAINPKQHPFKNNLASGCKVFKEICVAFDGYMTGKIYE